MSRKLYIVASNVSAIEGEYDGPKLEDDKVKVQFVEDLMKTYNAQGKLHRRYAYRVKKMFFFSQRTV